MQFSKTEQDIPKIADQKMLPVLRFEVNEFETLKMLPALIAEFKNFKPNILENGLLTQSQRECLAVLFTKLTANKPYSEIKEVLNSSLNTLNDIMLVLLNSTNLSTDDFFQVMQILYKGYDLQQVLIHDAKHAIKDCIMYRADGGGDIMIKFAEGKNDARTIISHIGHTEVDISYHEQIRAERQKNTEKFTAPSKLIKAEGRCFDYEVDTDTVTDNFNIPTWSPEDPSIMVLTSFRDQSSGDFITNFGKDNTLRDAYILKWGIPKDKDSKTTNVELGEQCCFGDGAFWTYSKKPGCIHWSKLIFTPGRSVLFENGKISLSFYKSNNSSSSNSSSSSSNSCKPNDH